MPKIIQVFFAQAFFDRLQTPTALRHYCKTATFTINKTSPTSDVLSQNEHYTSVRIFRYFFPTCNRANSFSSDA